MTATTEYGAESIQVLEGLSPVRKRPGMYIGSTGKSGFHHLVWEILDNSVDEAMEGHANHISLRINDDNSITISDNGRGIPVDPQKSGTQKGRPTVEVIMTTLHAGGKFDGGSYKYSGGLHGVGTSVVNALSEWMIVQVKRDGTIYEIKFASQIVEVDGIEQLVPGAVVEPLHVIGSCDPSETGTTTTFLPDSSVFTHSKWDVDLIKRRLSNAAFLNPGIAFEANIKDISGDYQSTVWSYPNGLIDYMDHVRDVRLADLPEPAEDEEAPSSILPSHLYLSDTKDGVGEWEICVQWFPGTGYTVDSFANGVETSDGGTHVDGFQQSLGRAINKYARNLGFLGDKDPDLDAHDIRSGLSVVISAKVREPIFQGQTKNILGNESVKSMIRTQFYDKLTSWMEDHPAEIALVIHKAVDEMRTRKRIEAAAYRERNAANPRGRTPKSEPPPSKLRDCLTKDRSKAELFVVEGDSAGGTAEIARNPEFQAFLPIRGKILNINSNWPLESDPKYFTKLEKLQNQIDGNEEIQALINALGAGSQDMFDISECRYDKLIFMTDADDDGRHIEALLTGVCFRLFLPMFLAGRIYVVQAPLFRSTIKDEPVYAFDTTERAEVDSKHPNLVWTRFKGLGEMNPEFLRDIVMDPQHRRLMRFTVDDVVSAEKMVNDMLGSNSDPKWNAVIEALHNDDTFGEFSIA